MALPGLSHRPHRRFARLRLSQRSTREERAQSQSKSRASVHERLLPQLVSTSTICLQSSSCAVFLLLPHHAGASPESPRQTSFAQHRRHRIIPFREKWPSFIPSPVLSPATISKTHQDRVQRKPRSRRTVHREPLPDTFLLRHLLASTSPVNTISFPLGCCNPILARAPRHHRSFTCSTYQYVCFAIRSTSSDDPVINRARLLRTSSPCIHRDTPRVFLSLLFSSPNRLCQQLRRFSACLLWEGHNRTLNTSAPKLNSHPDCRLCDLLLLQFHTPETRRILSQKHSASHHLLSVPVCGPSYTRVIGEFLCHDS